MTEDRCPWSDLPPLMCDHCTPGPRAHTRDFPRENVPLTIVTRAHIETISPTGRSLPEEFSQWELSDYIAALCEHTKHAEPRTILNHNRDGSITPVTSRHITVNPPLILQLQWAVETSQAVEEGKRQFTSKPSGRLEAIELVMRIEHETHRMLIHDHGERSSHDDYPQMIAAVRHLGSLTASGDSNARTIRGWWAAARVVTGWDLPAFKPNNTCPLCGVRGSLRIKYPTATCVECHETWDGETIGLLAEHIKIENHEEPDDIRSAG